MNTRAPTSPRKRFNPSFSRRTFLGGLGAATALAPFLPILESESQAGGTGFPKRLILLFSANGTIHENWAPTGSQDDFELSPILSPLQAHKDKLVVLDGMRVLRDGPGDAHQKGMGYLWTGSRLVELEGTEWGGGISIDQELANTLGDQTPFKSLEFGVQNGGANVWSRMSYGGANQPIAPENNPAAMFDRLFSELTVDTSQQQRIRAERRSVLDLVHRDLNRLHSRYSGSDRLKVESHLDSIREIESRNDAPVGGCEQPASSGANHTENANFPAVTRDMIDQMVMALSCDMTRIASLQWSRSVSNTRFEWIGIDESHHEISHLGDDDNSMIERITAINTWYAGEVAYLLDSLAAVPEGGGTMLDNTLVVWGNELSRGNSHGYHPVPFVLAGSAGGAIETGRYLKFDELEHNRLLVSILNAMGMGTQSFGDNDPGSGGLPGLLS